MRLRNRQPETLPAVHGEEFTELDIDAVDVVASMLTDSRAELERLVDRVDALVALHKLLEEVAEGNGRRPSIYAAMDSMPGERERARLRSLVRRALGEEDE
jgi:hypothetical protein